MIELILLSLVSGILSLIGGIFLLWKEKFTHRFITPLIALGAGAFLGAAFLDILPEAIEMTNEPHPVFLAALTGFISFFMLERIGMTYGKNKPGHIHSEHTETLPFLLILGDSLHNFLDGIIVAMAYLANPAIGLSTALAVAAHEIPQEMGDFSILLKLKFSKTKVLLINILQSLLTIPGVLIGYYLANSIQSYLAIMLGMTAGIFIYISASDLVPELHHQAGHSQFFKILIPFIASVVIIYYLTSLAHS